MSKMPTPTDQHEETPVDDVRQVRRRFSREAGGDVHKQIEESRRAAEQYEQRLGLKPVPPERQEQNAHGS